jgi:hypothetical protein
MDAAGLELLRRVANALDEDGRSVTIDTDEEPLDIDTQDITDGIEAINGKVDGHLSVASHTHIHRHLGELYTTGYYWGNAVSGTDYEIYIRNPTGSGKVLEIITTTVTADVGKETRLFTNVTWPNTGNSLTPINLDTDVADGINGDVEYGTDNADGGTLIPPVTISPAPTSGPSRTPSIQQNPNADIALGPGDVFALSATPDADGKLSLGMLIAEYDEERRIE